MASYSEFPCDKCKSYSFTTCRFMSIWSYCNVSAIYVYLNAMCIVPILLYYRLIVFHLCLKWPCTCNAWPELYMFHLSLDARFFSCKYIYTFYMFNAFREQIIWNLMPWKTITFFKYTERLFFFNIHFYSPKNLLICRV